MTCVSLASTHLKPASPMPRAQMHTCTCTEAPIQKLCDITAILRKAWTAFFNTSVVASLYSVREHTHVRILAGGSLCWEHFERHYCMYMHRSGPHHAHSITRSIPLSLCLSYAHTLTPSTRTRGRALTLHIANLICDFFVKAKARTRVLVCKHEGKGEGDSERDRERHAGRKREKEIHRHKDTTHTC